MRTPIILAVVALALGAIEAQDAQPVAAAPKPGGSIAGKVTLTGKVPKRKKIRVEADPVCADLHKDDPLLSEEVVTKEVGGENRLQWVAVYLDKVEGKFEPPKDPVKLDQKGCHYEPHVFVVQAGQPVKITNSDPTMHNIHAMPQINKEFNFGQAKAGMEEEKTFDQPENAVKIKCDVHPWMSAYAFVLSHPFGAVTKDDGTFEIANVPPGEYTIKFWHEKYGEKEAKVKVEEGKAATADAAFEPKE
jgi:plastocyanin